MYYIQINKNFVHQVGNQPRLCRSSILHRTAYGCCYHMELCNTVGYSRGIVVGWRLVTGWTVRGSNPDGRKEIFSSPHFFRPALGLTHPPVQ